MDTVELRRQFKKCVGAPTNQIMEASEMDADEVPHESELDRRRRFGFGGWNLRRA
jgi:hypothetical protein